jgi:hypothetical protein
MKNWVGRTVAVLAAASTLLAVERGIAGGNPDAESPRAPKLTASITVEINSAAMNSKGIEVSEVEDLVGQFYKDHPKFRLKDFEQIKVPRTQQHSETKLSDVAGIEVTFSQKN